MRKINNKKSLVLGDGNGNYVPNIIRGGNAIPLGNNFYYIKGRKHSAGGVDIGADPKTGLEVEGEEVMKVSPKEVRVYSSVPFLQGNSPAELVMGGANPDAVFNAQEEFKDRNRINDDGTKYLIGGEKQNRQIGDSPYEDPTFAINKKIDLRKNAGRATGLNIGKNTFNIIRNISRGLRVISPIGEFIQNVFPSKEAEYIQNANDYGRNPIKFDFNDNKLKLGGNKTTVQQDAIANYKPDLKYNNYENFEKAKSNAFHHIRQRNRLATNVAKGIVQVVDPTGISSYGDIVNDVQRGSHWLHTTMDVLSALPALNVVSSLARKTKIGKNVFRDLNLYYKADEYKPLVNDFVKGGKEAFENGDKYSTGFALRAADDILDRYKKVDAKIKPIEKGQYAVRGFAQNEDIKEAIDDVTNKKPLGGNLSTNQNDFLDTWNASRLATGRYNNQLGDGRLERQAESRNTAREFHSPIGFAMNYGKRAAIRTPSMSDTDYRKEIARNAQSMKLRLNTPETGQGVIGGAYHAPTHSSYINQEEFTKDPTVRTHENAHASRATEQEQVISDILGSSSSSTYLRRPTEVYSRLMQFRQANNLDPNTIYDKDNFRELRKTATDYNLINTFKEDEVIDLLNNVAMHNDPNQLNLNNINLNTVPVYAAKYGTKRKSKMGKVISINGNVRNGLIHTPSREAFAYGGERKPRFNGRYSKPGLHNLELLVADLLLPKGKVNIEPDVPKRLGWVEAHNHLVGADISQKSLDAKQDNTSVAHVISEREKRTRKFAAGGRSKAKTGTKKDNVIDEIVINAARPKLSAYSVLKDNDTSNRHSKKVIEREVYQADALSSDRLKTKIDNTPYKEKEIDTSYGDRIVTPLINSKSVTKAERNTNIRGRINNKYDSVEELLNRVRELGTDAQDKSNKDYIPYSSPVDNYGEKTFRNNITLDRLNRFGITPHTYGNGERTISNTSINDNQDIIESINNETPRKGSNQSSSSSTGGVNNRTTKPTKSTVQRINKLAPATNSEMAGLERGLTPMLKNNFADRLTKHAVDDYNVMPLQDNMAKTRNLDNIQFGINLGSSVIDALMGNIFANQLHSYTPPTITAPVISNPGEIKLNEEDLKDIPEPILMAAAKLKTRYNANPQLAKIEDETRRTMRDIDRNTSNSRVGLARKQLAALRGQEAKNQVYAQKENIETELINKDKLNQQEVTARNLARYDQYNQALATQMANRARLRLAADTANIQNKLAVSTANANLKAQADQFNAGNRINSLIHKAGIDGAKAEARANIVSNLLGNVGSAFDIWNRNKRQARLDEETLKVLGLRAPNVNKLMLRAIGINE